ncbi:MAG: hypothetical protein AAGH64_03005 [Planctomycetota bacterium]
MAAERPVELARLTPACLRELERQRETMRFVLEKAERTLALLEEAARRRR